MAITDVSNCQQRFCFLYYLFASSKAVKVFQILCYTDKLIVCVSSNLIFSLEIRVGARGILIGDRIWSLAREVEKL